MQKFTPITVLMLVLIAIPFLYIHIIVPYQYRTRWRSKIKESYLSIAATEYENKLFERLRDWILSKDAEKVYVTAPHEFCDIFYKKADEIANQLIQELKEKYVNKYKSRNKESTQTI